MATLQEILKQHEHQKNKLLYKKFTDLSEKEQLSWCQNQKNLHEMAYEAYTEFKNKRDFDNAIRCFWIAITCNNPKAKNELSEARKQNATVNLTQSIEEKQPEDLFYLALSYLLGVGQKKNRANALILFKKAAMQGLASAQFNLGRMHDEGEGTSPDKKQALFWYKKAAEQGHAAAQFNLGLMYYYGQGTSKDYKQALFWYQKAAEQGHAPAQFNLGLMHDEGEGTLPNKEQALFWYQKAAEQGYAPAQYNLGLMHDEGEGTSKNPQLASRWFRQSAELNNENAIEFLGEKKGQLFMNFHNAMLQGDIQSVVSLIQEAPILIKELIWDIERKSSLNLAHRFLPVIRNLRPNKSKPISEDGLNELKYAYLSKAHRQFTNHPDNSEFQSCFYNAIDLLLEIDCSAMSREQVIHLIQITIDTWYQSKEVSLFEEHNTLSRQLALALKLLLYRFNFLESAPTDTVLLRQIGLILIKTIYGDDFEITFNEPNMDHIMHLISLVQFNKKFPYQEINELFELDLIKPASPVNPVTLLIDIKKYLDLHGVIEQSPQLLPLKIYLGTQWANSTNKKKEVAEKVLFHLKTMSVETMKIVNMPSLSFFATDDQATRTIYKALANEDLKTLHKYLDEQMQLMRGESLNSSIHQKN